MGADYITAVTSPPTLERLYEEQRLPMVRLALLLVDDLAWVARSCWSSTTAFGPGSVARCFEQTHDPHLRVGE